MRIKNRLKNLDVGTVLHRTCGDCEIVEPYSPEHDWYTVRKILVNDRGEFDGYGDEDHLTPSDLIGAEIF